MTGRDTFLMGMQFEELTDFAPWGVPLEEATLAERFKAAGYATHMVSIVKSSIHFHSVALTRYVSMRVQTLQAQHVFDTPSQ